MEPALKRNRTKTTNRNRYDTSPIYGENGNLQAIPPHKLTDFQLSLIKAGALDRFLSWDYFARLVGSNSRSHVLLTLEKMRSAPYAYFEVCEEQQDRSKRHMYQNIKLQNQLTKLGREVAFDHFGIRVPEWKPTSYIAHHIMGDHALASLRIGAQESQGRFAIRSSHELLANQNMPESTRRSKTPFHIPLGDTITTEKAKVVPHTIRPDREIFAILDYETDNAFFFGGLETGTGSETHQPTTPRHDHSYTISKLTDYKAIIKRGIYETHFGFPNFYMLFIERNERRFEKPIEIWRDMTDDAKWMRPYIWFKTHHLFTEKYEATGRMLTEPFLIVDEGGTTTQFSLVQST